jgi:hypothetical protein
METLTVEALQTVPLVQENLAPAAEGKEAHLDKETRPIPAKVKGKVMGKVMGTVKTRQEKEEMMGIVLSKECLLRESHFKTLRKPSVQTAKASQAKEDLYLVLTMEQREERFASATQSRVTAKEG